MKKLRKLVIGSSILLALSLLNPVPVIPRPITKQETGWYIDDRFDKLYDYIEKNKMDPIEMIKEASKESNIVCVGEMHDESHREFAIKHLKELNDVFEYFGVEVSNDYNDEDGKFDYERYTKNHNNVSRQEADEYAMQKAAIDAVYLLCTFYNAEIVKYISG